MSATIELPITGMTCASCANRIERKLNKLDGVSASVNYATEKATVDYDPAAVEPSALVGAVEAAGYHAVAADRRAGSARRRRRDRRAALPADPVGGAVAAGPAGLDDPGAAVRQLAVAGAQRATPVVLWGAWPFHQAAWANLSTARRRWTR